MKSTGHARRVRPGTLSRQSTLEPLVEVDVFLEIARTSSDGRVNRFLQEQVVHTLRRCGWRRNGELVVETCRTSDGETDSRLAAAARPCSDRAVPDAHLGALSGHTRRMAGRKFWVSDTSFSSRVCEEETARLTRRSYSHRSCSSSFIHSSGSCSHFCRSSCLSGNIRVIKTSANCCTKSGETGRAEVPSQSPSMALMSRRA